MAIEIVNSGKLVDNGKSWDEMVNYPLVMTNSMLWKIAIETVSFPMENDDFP